jgi:hypothetical protein
LKLREDFMKKIVLAIVLFTLLSPFAGFGAEKLKLRSGSWQVGGAFSFMYTQAVTEASDPNLIASLGINAGYFITRETIIGLTVNSQFGLLLSTSPTSLSANLESIMVQFRYLLSTEEQINLYFGFGTGYAISIALGPGIAWADVLRKQLLILNLTAGMYIPLSQSVALDIQLVPTIGIPLGNTGVMGILVPIYLGIATFIY